MKGIDIKIGVKVNQKDFTIIYKGKSKVIDQIVEAIEEIQTTKEDLFRSLRYFKERSQELQQQDEIYIHDKFPNEIFKNFIKCVEQKEIYIDSDNYNDYLELSKKYKFYELEKEILNFIQQRPDLNQILDELSVPNEEDENSIQNSIEKVEIISKNLDFCIQSGALKKLPLKMLLRVLNSPNRVLKNHHFLFEFVKSLFKNSKKEEIENLTPLLSSLDFAQMSVEEIDEFVNNKEFVSSIFSPQNSNKAMKTLVDDIRIKNEVFNSFEKEIPFMKQKIDENEQKMKEQKEKIEIMEQKIIQQNKVITKNANEIKSDQKQLNILLNDTNSKFEEEISIIKQKNNENEQIMEKHKEKIEKELKSFEEMIQKQEGKDKKIFIRKEYNKAFSGIISKLTKIYHGNVNDLGIINISGNRYDSNIVSGKFSSLIDYNYVGYSYFSDLDEKSFICFDFKSFYVSISAYSIKSSNNGDPDFLTSWVIEGSKDQKKWTQLDVHVNEKSLCSLLSVKTFFIQDLKKVDLQFQFIRLRITDQSSKGSYRIDLTNIEFFGKCIQK